MRRAALVVLVATIVLSPLAGADAAPSAGRVVVFALPGVTWKQVGDARTPNLDALVERGAVAAVSVRSVQRGTSPLRGYLTLGAGARAFAPKRPSPARDDPQGQLALPAGARFEGGTAAEAFTRRTGAAAGDGLVHLSIPYLRAQDRKKLFGTQLGALGQALREAKVPRAVVSAADLAVTPREPAMRRTAVLALADARGRVDNGTLTGLLRPDADAPFGVATDPDRFMDAARAALDVARVVLLDTGETLRADEFIAYAAAAQGERQRRLALERTDAILGRVVAMLDPEDVLYVLAPSSPINEPNDHVTPLVVAGRDVPRGWLTSPATRRAGIVTLIDIAPTILRTLDAEVPPTMRGTIARSVPSNDNGRLARLETYDRDSLFRERILPVATAIVIAFLSFIAVLSFLTFVSPWRWGRGPLRALSYGALALAPAAVLIRVLGVYETSPGIAIVSLLGLTALMTVLAYLVPGPRWAAGVILLLFSFGVAAADLVVGAPMALSGVFGYSPGVGGRFYGAGNLGYAIMYATAILGLVGVADLLGHQRAPWWLGAGLGVMVVIEGAPVFGADVGGVLAGVPAVALTWILARSRRVRWRTVVGFAIAAVVLTAVAIVVDALRPPAVQTHLGRFGSELASGGIPYAWTVVRRKALENIGLLDFTPWLYTIPIAVAVLVMLLWRPRGVLAEHLPKHPLLRAGLIGSLVAGVAGFAVNDSGIIIPAMVRVHVVPFFVLMGLQPPPRAVAS